MSQDFPEYVTVGVHGVALRYSGIYKGHHRYWRDAGAWRVGAKWRDGQLVADSFGDPMVSHLDGVPLIETTREVYLECNAGYV